MPTFILKKYNNSEQDQVNQETPKEVKEEEKEEDKKLSITVSGSISGIVANALYKVLENTNVHIEEVEEVKEDSSTKAISAEDINISPVNTFNSINKDDVVFIHSKGFTTAAEEWFLTNIPNKTNKVFYTIESFIKFVKTEFKLA